MHCFIRKVRALGAAEPAHKGMPDRATSLVNESINAGICQTGQNNERIVCEWSQIPP